MLKKEKYAIPGAKSRMMLMDLTYKQGNRSAPLIIFVHGFKGFKDWGTHHLLADAFALAGYRFLKFNFSHNGTTPDQPTEFADLSAFGENTFTIELEDLNRVIDFVCSGSAIPAARQVILMGHSMGGGISIIQAAEDKRVSHLITLASIAGFRNLWPKLAEVQWRIQGVMYIPNKRTGQQMPLKASLLDDLDQYHERLNITAKAAQITKPWLLLHGNADETVPLTHGEQLAAANPAAQFEVVPSGDHTFGGTHPFDGVELPAPLKDVCKRSITFLNMHQAL